jgi:CUB/sushi domain-containing protein
LNIISSFGNLIQNFGNLDENNKLNYLSNIPPKDTNNINVVNFKTNESDINNNNEALNNINSNSNNNLNEQNDIDNNIVEPKLKFTNTFKKLSIDLNDEPTEFNVEEINVNTNSMDINIQETESYPIILLPIVLYISHLSILGC